MQVHRTACQTQQRSPQGWTVAGHDQAGAWVIDLGSKRDIIFVAIDLLCPWCHERLQKVTSKKDIMRIVKSCSGSKPCDALGVIVPDTHEVLACLSCKMAMTRVKEQQNAAF